MSHYPPPSGQSPEPTGSIFNQPVPKPAASGFVGISKPDAAGSDQTTKPVASGPNTGRDHSENTLKETCDHDEPGAVDASAPAELDASDLSPIPDPVATSPRSNQKPEPTSLESDKADPKKSLRSHVADGEPDDQLGASAADGGHNSSVPKGVEVSTISEAASLLYAKGFTDEGTPRNVQRYCRNTRRKGQLKCYWDDKSRVHLVDKQSLEEFAEKLANEIPKGDATQTTVDDLPQEERNTPPVRSSDITFESIIDHPYVKDLKAETTELKKALNEIQKEKVLMAEGFVDKLADKLNEAHKNALLATSDNVLEVALKTLRGEAVQPSDVEVKNSPSEQ